MYSHTILYLPFHFLFFLLPFQEKGKQRKETKTLGITLFCFNDNTCEKKVENENQFEDNIEHGEAEELEMQNTDSLSQSTLFSPKKQSINIREEN